jgi:hypothetical protein
MLDNESTVEYTRLNDCHTKTLQDRDSPHAPYHGSVRIKGGVLFLWGSG